MTLGSILGVERRRQRGPAAAACLAAAGVGIAAVLLPALSGWFISGAALAGAAGAAAAIGFNTLLPSAAIRLLAIVRTLCRYGERVAGHDSALRVMASVRPQVYLALAAAPPARAFEASSGDTVARVTNDVNEIEAGLIRRPAGWAAAAASIAGLVMLSMHGLEIAGLVLLTVAAAGVAAVRLARASVVRGEEAVLAAASLKEDAMRLLSARAELRAYDLEDWAVFRIVLRSATAVAAQRKAAAISGTFETAAAAAGGAAAMGALALSASQPLPAAALSALAGLATAEIIAAWGRGLQRRGQLAAATRRLDEAIAGRGPPRGMDTLPPHADIELPALRVRLRPGTVLGVQGPSGCGKTTLLETFAGLRAAAPGMIRVGGTDLADMPQAAAHPLVSLLAQDAPILAGTVRENLLLARYGATDTELWEALRCAVLDGRVAALPGGLDAWVGEGGARLSGGERRRLCLARALLRPAPWLLLDEPTEGLDAVTEALVVDRLRVFLSATGQGAVIASHRAAPLTLADRIVRLDPRHSLATPVAAAVV